VLGALTTWSALMLETLLYLRSGRGSTLLLYFGTTWPAACCWCGPGRDWASCCAPDSALARGAAAD
jgi:fluoride ion exporter CrcB/FEX